jgi:allantoate deiminase
MAPLQHHSAGQPPPVAPYAATALERCDRLATFSEEPDRLTRRFATAALRDANAAVLHWMREAGMAVRQDAIGNVVGRWDPTGDAPATLLMGSHLDTVAGAGRYDGMLGVLVALACVERRRDSGRALPFAVEVVGFADEEGVRYGTAYLGSSVVAGTFDNVALERQDADGVSMAAAIAAFGGDVAGLAAARRDPTDLIGYCEVHIEQGPVLEADGLPVGVVSGIAGQSRAEVAFEGVAGHAGTVPMRLRHDALCAAAEWIVAAEALARDEGGLVATVGRIAAEPGASNVIPARTMLTLDVRHLDDAVREAACARMRDRAEAIARDRGLAAGWTLVQETPAVRCSPALSDALAEAVGATGHEVARLPSGAGHDAAVISRLTPVGMLFVRCAKGISHNPAEAVALDDVAVAIDVVDRFFELLTITPEPQEARTP